MRELLMFFGLFPCYFCIDETLFVLNGWKLDNLPLKMTWPKNSKHEESSEWIQNFNNDDAYRIRWSCSAVLNDTMYMIGGLPDGDDEITNLYKIRFDIHYKL